MANLAVIVKIKAVVGQRDELASLLGTAFPTVENESGTLKYLMHEDQSDPDTLWFYELYTGKEAQDAHLYSDASKALGEKLGPLIGAPPEIYPLTPLGGKDTK